MIKSTSVVMLVLLATAAIVQPHDLVMVASVPYREIQPLIKTLSPDYDFGDLHVEIWATVDRDCFNDDTDVIDAFGDWLENCGPSGIPLCVEIRCKPWNANRSIVVVSQFNDRRQPPTHLWLFSASANGASLDRMLVEDGSVGRALIENHRLAFTLDQGRATSVLVLSQYPERSGPDGGSPEWVSTDVYLLDGKTHRVHLDVIGAYRRGNARSASILLVTRDRADGEPIWQLRSVSSSVEVMASSEPIPRMHGASKAQRVQAEVDALRPVLAGIAGIRAAEDTTVLFESSVVGELLERLE